MLAIVIPYFKLSFFKETLQSLDNQTDQRFKVYIGDDASPENPTILLEKYKGKFDFVYHRFEENLGGISLTQQWERCIARTDKEEWLMILGDDDVLGGNVVEQFYRELVEVVKYDITVIRYSTYKIDEKGGLISEIYNHPKLENAIDFLFRKTRSSLSEYIFRKQEVLGIRFKNFPLGWFSDILAVLEFSRFNNIFTINKAIIYIRISKLNISGLNGNEKEKLNSQYLYYEFLLIQKNKYFKSDQIICTLKNASKLYLNDKRNILLFFRITKLYLKNGLPIEYFLFLKNIFQSII